MTKPTACRKNNLHEHILDYVRGGEQRCTPRDLVRAVASARHLDRKTVRRAVDKLVAENRLAYTQHLGHTFLEISYRRPVHVGGGVILAPPEVSATTGPGQTLIRIAPGAAFGMGDHATTRLALRLIAWIFREGRLACTPAEARVLDIGTGSGVLAIGACLMGAGPAEGVDTDACARTEAAHNIALNGLKGRIRITDTLEAAVQTAAPFSLILANLRYPSLARLCGRIRRLCAPGAVLVLSGFREKEQADLIDTYSRAGFQCLQTLAENRWCAIALGKNP